MLKTNKLIKAILVMVIFSFGSKILGFLREVLIAAKFGSGAETDAFFIALAAIGLFKVMITSAINTTMIPMMADIESVEGKIEKKKQTNNVLNIVITVSMVTILIGWILSPYIIKIVAYGFEGEQFDLTVYMMRIGIITILFSGIVAVFRGYLQSESKFTESAVADIPFNLTYLLFLIFLSGIYGIKGLIITSALAVCSQLFIQIPGLLKLGYKYNFIIDIKNKYVKKAATLVPPVLVSVAILDINTIVDRTLASTLLSGSVSALNYGNRLTVLVLGVFIAAITTVLFPLLSSEAKKKGNGEFKNVVKYGINSILLITIPVTVGIIILAKPIVRLTFERGEFDAHATSMTIGALIFYSLGLVGMALRLFMEKVYYSLQDTKTPMINGIFTVVLNIVLNIILMRFMAHEGLAFATAISITITSILLIYGLRKRLGSIESTKYFKCAVKSLFASLLMGLIVYNIYYRIFNISSGTTFYEVLIILLAILIGTIVYLVLIYILKVEEINWIYKRLQNKKIKN